MSVGAFAFMLQLLVYVREKYKNHSTLFSAFDLTLEVKGWVISERNVQAKDLHF